MISVLNAFRHHRNSHLPPSLDPSFPLRDQHLSASSDFTQNHCLYINRSLSVYNPFRHYRNSHTNDYPIFVPLLACSTLFAIIEIPTNTPSSAQSPALRAQRLSASSEFTHVLS